MDSPKVECRGERILFNTKTGEAVQVTVARDGTALSMTPYTPSSTQVSRIVEIMANLDSLNVPMGDAVNQAVTQYVGAGIHEAELVTAALVEIDVWIDASVVQSFLSSIAAVNHVTGAINEDFQVDGLDLAEFFAMWGVVNPIHDYDGDGAIGAGDLSTVLSNWSI